MSTKNENTNALAILTEFERRLAACTTLVEAKVLRDEAEALRYYCQTMQVGLAVQNRCAMARFMAERKLGEMLAKLPRAPGPGRGKRNAVADNSFLKQIEREGILFYNARRWQRMARVPEPEFRRMLEGYCAGSQGDTSCTADVLDAAVVDKKVSWWIEDHRTPQEEARAERRERAYEARQAERRNQAEQTDEERREDAWWQSEVGGLWEDVNGSLGRARWMLEKLQRRAAEVGEMIALVNQVAELCRAGMEADKAKMFAAPTA